MWVVHARPLVLPSQAIAAEVPPVVPFDPYLVLGVDRSATLEEIRQAYRALARRYHPDLNRSPDAEDRFKELGQAFAVLNDPERRRAYDRWGAASLQAGFEPGSARSSAEPAPPRRGRPRPSAAREPAQWADDEAEGPEVLGPRPSELDLVVPLEIDLATAISGGEVRARSPHGAVLALRIPSGVETGYQIQLKGRGQVGRGGRPPGDLYFEVHVQPHPFFHREGIDLVLDLPITIDEAQAGARIQIPSLEGWIRVRVPAGSRGGERLRLRGKGLSAPGGGRGDLHVHLCIRLPERMESIAHLLDRIGHLYAEPVRAGLRL